jgi:hypothetical protein
MPGAILFELFPRFTSLPQVGEVERGVAPLMVASPVDWWIEAAAYGVLAKSDISPCSSSSLFSGVSSSSKLG